MKQLEKVFNTVAEEMAVKDKLDFRRKYGLLIINVFKATKKVIKVGDRK